MLVIKRRVGESVVVGNDVMVSVSAIDEAAVTFSLTRVNCEYLGTIPAPLMQFVAITPEVSAAALLIDSDEVRIGINAPATCSVERAEAWASTRRRN
jgi:sRNA-binding carbon storage regulator CsrA